MKIAIIENPSETDLITMLAESQKSFLEADQNRKVSFVQAMCATQLAVLGEVSDQELKDATAKRDFAETRTKVELAGCLSLARSLADKFPSEAHIKQLNFYESLGALHGVSV